MGKYGTLNVLEDLAEQTDPITDADREREIAARFAEALAIHDKAFQEMVEEFATQTDRTELPFAGADDAIIQELDEWGAADASKATSFGNVGFPLRIYGGTIQWTRNYFRTVSAAELASQLDAFATADIKIFQNVLKAVLFKATNTTDYFDRLQTKQTYDLKALLNADGQAIPPGPSGQTFDGSTHTHYLGKASLTAANGQELLDTVIEHGIDGKLVYYIAKADEATVRGFSGFSPYVDARVTVVGAAQIGNESLDVQNPDNRAIGVFGGAEVWVKPWVPANYQVALDLGGGLRPLGIRTRGKSLTSGEGSFQIQAENEIYPLRARNLGREYGVSAYGRHKAAVMKSNNATYSPPS